MPDVPQVCTALSSVWAAVLNAALAVVVASRCPTVGAAGADRCRHRYGRLGGGELGYGSDADVIFVCDPVRASTRRAINWATTAPERRWLPIAAGVDIDLRPEGTQRSGRALAGLNSMGAALERSRRCCAHQVAGDDDLGIDFLHGRCDPPIRPGGVSPEAVREIRRIKARVDAERSAARRDPAMHTKLGRGGLADVEWTVSVGAAATRPRPPFAPQHLDVESLDAIAADGLLPRTRSRNCATPGSSATKARNALVLVRGKPVDELPGPGSAQAVAFAAGWPADDSGSSRALPEG